MKTSILSEQMGSSSLPKATKANRAFAVRRRRAVQVAILHSYPRTSNVAVHDSVSDLMRTRESFGVSYWGRVTEASGA